MAGAHHGPEIVRKDPAIIKWASMTKNRHKYFRWTRRTATITFMYMAVVPGMLGVLAYATDGKWSLRGKKRGDLISDF